MISRLILNLRSVYTTDTEYDSESTSLTRNPINMRRVIPDQSFLTRTIGNLGEDVIVSGYTSEVTGDKADVGIALAKVSRRSEVSGNIPRSETPVE